MFSKWPTTGALLLVEENGSEAQNSTALALQYARKILCKDNERSGALFDAKTHTDFQLITPEPKTQWIKIDQIRALIEWSNAKPQIAHTKVAVISPAQALNVYAANSLLKTLEELPLDTLFILVTNRPHFIPATIRSRCYWIRCRAAAREYSDTIALKTQMLEGLQSLETKKGNPVSIGMQWMKQDPKQTIDCLWMILETKIKNTLKKRLSCHHALWQLLDQTLEAKRELESPISNDWLLMGSQ